MRLVGMRPVVVHGGGPQISDLMARLGKQATFVDGLRVTDAETVDIARMVLQGQVNPQLVAAINVHGRYAVGISGVDAGFDPRGRPRSRTRLRRRRHRDQPGGDPRADRRRVHPGHRHDRQRHRRSGVQHQRRHGRRSDRRGAGRREARLPHRHRGPPSRRRRPCQPDSPDHRRRTRLADRRRDDRRRDDPQGRELHRGGAQRGPSSAHPRRAHRARVAARGVHRRRHRHDGQRRTTEQETRPDGTRIRPRTPPELSVHAGLRRAVDHVRTWGGHRTVGHERQALPRLPRRHRRGVARPRQPDDRRCRRRSSPPSDARVELLHQPGRGDRRRSP